MRNFFVLPVLAVLLVAGTAFGQFSSSALTPAVGSSTPLPGATEGSPSSLASPSAIPSTPLGTQEIGSSSNVAFTSVPGSSSYLSSVAQSGSPSSVRLSSSLANASPVSGGGTQSGSGASVSRSGTAAGSQQTSGTANNNNNNAAVGGTRISGGMTLAVLGVGALLAVV